MPAAAPVYQPDPNMVVTGVMDNVNPQVMPELPVNLAETKPVVPATVKSEPATKGLVIDESVTLTPGATVQVYRCPVATCTKPCVTLRAFKMHAKCVHKNCEGLQPTQELTTANFICKVTKKNRQIATNVLANKVPIASWSVTNLSYALAGQRVWQVVCGRVTIGRSHETSRELHTEDG